MSIFGKIVRRLKFNSSRIYLSKFVENAASELKAGAIILDAGAGDGRYSIYFQNVHYESADICKLERPYHDITYVCDLSNIPVENERFDAIICTQVLEHVNEPSDVLNELNRVLKSGGKLYLTAPLFYPEHEVPYDFYRYTQFGFKYLLQKSKFEVEKIEWLEGYLMTLANQMWIAFESLSIFNKRLGLLNVIYFPIALCMKLTSPFVAYIFARLDLITKITNKGHCKNYAVIARKQ